MTNETKQTAVEWLYSWMGKNQYFIGNDLLQALEQAKEMEKEQMIESFYQGQNNSVDYFIPDCAIQEAEQYYKQTYGGNKWETYNS